MSISQPSSHALAPSVSSLKQSLSSLNSSLDILSSGISDFPRLKSVLQSTRHFELVPQSTLANAQQSLHDELGPAIEELLQRAENVVVRLERRERALEARKELLEGRVGEAGGRQGRRKSVAATGGESASALRLKMLVQKKERLGYAVERLGLQSQQRQRQLRMSVAATKD